MKNKSYNYIMNIVSKNNIKLSKLEQSIMDRLKDSPIEFIDTDISQVANNFYISNSTITRFSQKLGFDGFLELKYAMSNHDDNYAYITQNRYISILNDLEMLNKEAVELINNLDKFRKIFIVGIGSSGLLANEFLYKLSELGLTNTDYAKEPYKIDMIADSLASDDLLICLSLSGENSNIIKAAKFAQSHGTKILSISGSEKAELEKYSDVYIRTPKYSTHQYSISKMFPILLIIDIICEIYSNRS